MDVTRKGSTGSKRPQVLSNETQAGDDLVTSHNERELFTAETNPKKRKSDSSLEDAAMKKSLPPISMRFGSQKIKEPLPSVSKANLSVSNVFNDDDDDDVEEMPPEAKMRMRNLGRDTPTSAGPNSFGKTRQGFCGRKRGIDKEQKNTRKDIQSDIQ